MKKDTVAFEQIVSRGCGMDVHKEIVVVTIQGKGIKMMTKNFHTYTSSLIKLRDWLKKHKVTHIAMESTGVYWKPIYNVMGDAFEILLVNARHVKNGAIGIMAEIGADMSPFPDHKHLASWAGMCPASSQSAGKNKSGRITYGNKYLRSTLVELGWAASRTKNTYFESKFKSMVGRRSKKKTIIALGHKILIATYHIIKDKVALKELGADHLNNFRRDKLVAYYKKQLANLGQDIVQVA